MKIDFVRLKSIFNLIPIHYFKTKKESIYTTSAFTLDGRSNGGECGEMEQKSITALNSERARLLCTARLHYHDSLPLLKLSKFLFAHN